jgi:N-acetylmuramic acid 6-phosphate etherase
VPVTESLHPDGAALDGLGASALVVRLHAGDREAVAAVGGALPAIARLALAAERALAGGGRLLYAGAGTSGRLAALDAAECPPTFGVDPRRVVALVAGGAAALGRAVEGAEDDVAAGRRAVARVRAGPRDLVVGVSASGTTPFVLAALAEARRRGAATGLVTSNPAARPAVDHRVVLRTGRERIAGSTRMKAGTAAKMALGLLTSTAFVRLGAVRGGRMVAARPVSAKLRARAVRTVAALAGVEDAAAGRALRRAGGSVAGALRALQAAARRDRRS